MKRIAGNLRSWPSVVTEAGPWYELPVMRAGMKSLATVQRYELPGGFHLLIGRDVQVRAQLRKMLTDALLWAAVCGDPDGDRRRAGDPQPVPPHAGQHLGDLHRHRRAATSRKRVRLTGRGDEFDQIAEVINDMLDRIGRLMDGVRQVSNAIAHDLRTPITRARTRLEDAALHAESADDLRAAIERATVGPRRHRRGVPGAAADRRDRGRIPPLLVRPPRPRAAAGRGRRVVRRGGGGARHHPARSKRRTRCRPMATRR